MPARTNGKGAASELPLDFTKAHPPPAERLARGKALRDRVPRSTFREWKPPANRPEPIELVKQVSRNRVKELIPIRNGRMAASPFTYYRGSALMMAADLSQALITGITTQLCGDAHLANFGLYASPERQLVFDINDFDETAPGPWEWDLARLSASVVLAGRQNGLSAKQCEAAARQCVRGYRAALRLGAEAPRLTVWYAGVSERTLQAEHTPFLTGIDKKYLRWMQEAAGKADRGTPEWIFRKMVTETDKGLHFDDEPPILTRVREPTRSRVIEALVPYAATTLRGVNHLLDGYHVVDVAHRVVGVGSVGLRAWLVLLMGNGPHDLILLQLKEAGASCLAEYIERVPHSHGGQRVVEGAHLLQTVSDPFLGWTTIEERAYYVRQFRDRKGSVALANLDAESLAEHAEVCGMVLAKGHARASDAAHLAGYCGSSEVLDEAMAAFAATYADLMERDHAKLVRAIKAGVLPAEEGV